MVRRPIRESIEEIKVRRVNLLPSNLARQDTFPVEITLGTNLQPTLAYPAGLFRESSQIVESSFFKELVVAQGGSGLDSFDNAAAAIPASYNPTDTIERSAGYKRFDVLIQTYDADIRVTGLDGVVIGVLRLPPGRYSFDLNCKKLEIQAATTAGGLFQLVGYYTVGKTISS